MNELFLGTVFFPIPEPKPSSLGEEPVSEHTTRKHRGGGDAPLTTLISAAEIVS